MSHVLLEYGAAPFNSRFEDLEGRAAFTITEVEKTPNVVVRLTREAAWSQHQPEIMGPKNSFFYLGPLKSPGNLSYGNGPFCPMSSFLQQQRDNSTSRYFTAQNHKRYKWRRVGLNRMECTDGKSIIAIWDAVASDQYQARLTIKATGLPICTEIVTTLMLNRMALALNW